MNPLTEMLRPFSVKISQMAQIGDRRAQRVIDLYRLHCSCPSDPCAQTLCEAAFNEWLSHAPKNENGEA